jgi:hypothetical protein
VPDLDAPVREVVVEGSIEIDAPIERVFALSIADVGKIAATRPPRPLPRPVRAELVGDLAVGSIRRVHLTNGRTLDELIERLEPPRRLDYRITNGFGAPLDWLVRGASGSHRLEPLGERTRMIWQGTFEARGPISHAILRVVAPFVFTAMHRSFLGAVAREHSRAAGARSAR